MPEQGTGLEIVGRRNRADRLARRLMAPDCLHRRAYFPSITAYALWKRQRTTRRS